MIFRPMSFRPIFGRILTIGVSVVGVFALVALALTGDPIDLARYCWVVFLVIALAFCLFWLPRIDVEVHEITVHNVLRTFHVPWPALQRIDTKFALTLYTEKGTIPVWASPAPNRHSALTTTARDARQVAESGLGPGGSIRPGDALHTESGAVANVIRRHWEQLRDDGFLDNPVVDDEAYRVTTNWRSIVALGVLAVLAVLGIAL